MGTNHHTAWASGTTSFTAASMNPALASLDRAITYHKGALVGCDGTLSWTAGTLTWSGILHIYFTSAAGKTIVIRGFMAVIFLLVLNAVIMGAVLSDQLKARSKHPAAEMTNSTRAIESLLEFPEEKRTLPAMLTRKIRRH